MLQTVSAIARVLIVFVAGVVGARDALLLVYLSALIAMGFAPLVKTARTRAEERDNGFRAGSRFSSSMSPSCCVFVIVGLIVIPPLVAQANALWAKLPDEFDKLQGVLIRYRLLRRRVTLAEAVPSAPTESGARRRHCAGGIVELRRRPLRHRHRADSELLFSDRSPVDVPAT